jgi:hypothetical protein
MASFKASVLVVDDDICILRMMKHTLELEGYRVLTASDGNLIGIKPLLFPNQAQLKRACFSRIRGSEELFPEGFFRKSGELASKHGVPGGARTHDLLLRRQSLYPAELQGQDSIPLKM